jgi:hypothetical protein
MGLLDDAIRDHLDLKRRRGADPAEIDRAEREALGPVRRGPDDLEGLAPTQEPGLAYDGDDAEEWEDEPIDGGELEREYAIPDAPAAEPTPVPAHPPLDQEPPEPVDPDAPPGGRKLFAADEPFAEPEPSTRPPGEETAEYDVERALDEEGEQQGEDVLEETPEFLQDTPDHDRLWFEQRPPRDFDFNE